MYTACCPTFQTFGQVFRNVAETCNSGGDVVGQPVSVVRFQVQCRQQGMDGVLELVHLLVGKSLEQVPLQAQEEFTRSLTL